jgi:uncharacterized protein (DUF2141 family)
MVLLLLRVERAAQKSSSRYVDSDNLTDYVSVVNVNLEATMRLIPLSFLCVLLAGNAAVAADLVVNVAAVRSADGEVGCALHADPVAFPLGNADTPMQWAKADPAGMVCRFTDLRPGAYAVSVSHDLNGNRKTDTNFLGIPREDWGVSNNVRPTLRAPTFDEAKIDVQAERVTIVEVRLGR